MHTVLIKWKPKSNPESQASNGASEMPLVVNQKLRGTERGWPFNSILSKLDSPSEKTKCGGEGSSPVQRQGMRHLIRVQATSHVTPGKAAIGRTRLLFSEKIWNVPIRLCPKMILWSIKKTWLLWVDASNALQFCLCRAGCCISHLLGRCRAQVLTEWWTRRDSQDGNDTKSPVCTWRPVCQASKETGLLSVAVERRDGSNDRRYGWKSIKQNDCPVRQWDVCHQSVALAPLAENGVS